MCPYIYIYIYNKSIKYLDIYHYFHGIKALLFSLPCLPKIFLPSSNITSCQIHPSKHTSISFINRITLQMFLPLCRHETIIYDSWTHTGTINKPGFVMDCSQFQQRKRKFPHDAMIWSEVGFLISSRLSDYFLC